MWSQMLLPDNHVSFKPNHFAAIFKLQSEIQVVDLNNSNSSNNNGSFEISVLLEDLNKSSNNPLNSSADADRTEKYNYAQDDNIDLTEEAGNDDNPATGELEVGKILDTSKVIYFAKNRSVVQEKSYLVMGRGLTSRLVVVEYSGIFPGLVPPPTTGNSKYLRTPDFAMTEIKDILQTDKPHIIYEKLKKKYDEVTRPTGMQTIRDKKKYQTRRDIPQNYRGSYSATRKYDYTKPSFRINSNTY
ncbi:hypothetical protein CHS0354_034742 [Potamilus streckersoni]|uniref:Uncharacterized protein n=1 Tax=Potamilus streckersoni TaxID=2493646 RepID=A0AAE0VHY5_9BIVA|nr:hypothetical protein CHS0354_034742 [Potamilus streckersoni]